MSSRWALRVSERVHSAMLVLYPKQFRDAFGSQMAQVFRDECREAVGRAGIVGLIALWARTVFDLLFTALAERRKASAATNRVQRLRHALLVPKGRRSRTGLWVLIAVFSLLIIEDIYRLYLGTHGILEVLTRIFPFLWIICFMAGELTYESRRNLAGLLWVTGAFLLLPLGIALFAVASRLEESIFLTVAALLASIYLLVLYGIFLWRYLFTEGGSTRRELDGF